MLILQVPSSCGKSTFCDYTYVLPGYTNGWKIDNIALHINAPNDRQIFVKDLFIIECVTRKYHIFILSHVQKR